MDAEEQLLGMSAVDARELLERFVVENDDLLDLESRIGRFNIFDALRITDTEIRHSNFLAFLLDPDESHGQGPLFLKAILMDLFRKAPPEKRPQGCSPVILDGTDLRGVDVKREWKHIDLLITCKEPRFVVAIENKIWATEGLDQLSRYEEEVKKHYPGAGALFVYLTLNGEAASREAWMPHCHEDIYLVLKRVRDANQKSIGDEVLVFLDHYLNLIGIRFMNDNASKEFKEIDELCQAIYKKHRAALDLIWKRVGNPVSRAIADAASEFKNSSPRWSVVTKRRGNLAFVPKAWLAWLPPLGIKGENEWIKVSAWREEGRLVCALGVIKMVDEDRRKQIVCKLLEEWARFGFKLSKAKSYPDWAYISSTVCILAWKEDSEPDADRIYEAMKTKLDEFLPKLEKLEPVLKSLCEQPPTAPTAPTAT